MTESGSTPDTFDVIFAPQARRSLSVKLPETVAAAALEFIMGPLRENPYRVGKPLKRELSGFYSARRGEYRVIYRVRGDVLIIEIVNISHRRDVYRHR